MNIANIQSKTAVGKGDWLRISQNNFGKVFFVSSSGFLCNLKANYSL